jgi:glycosyltransferase involved in cell wall biosynthesis
MEDRRVQPSVGVVIPTYNRAQDLLTCLRHLERQSCRNFEVLVTDDGSTDDTVSAVRDYARASPFPLTYMHQQNSGPAAARNRAIQKLHAPIGILIGDDIFPAPHFVATHLNFHLAHPQPEAVAVGYTRWCEDGQVVTPFMRWLDRGGVQFNYGELDAGTPPSWKHFYTSNLSFKTEYLRQNAFDAAFRKAAMEDIELGYRLEQQHGLQMFYLPDAIAEHRHPTTFRRACRRMVDVGTAAFLFAQRWPEHQVKPSRSRLKRTLAPLLLEPSVILPALTAAADLATSLAGPNVLTRTVLLLHERLGYRQASQAAAEYTAAQEP